MSSSLTWKFGRDRRILSSQRHGYRDHGASSRFRSTDRRLKRNRKRRHSLGVLGCHAPAASVGWTPVVSLSGLYRQIFLLYRDLDLVIARLGGVGSIRGVAEAVLVAQLVFDLSVDLIDRLFLGNLKQPSAGLFRDAVQNFLSVRMLLWEPAS